MIAWVKPETFLLGTTVLHREGVEAFLEQTGRDVFQEEIAQARRQGLTDGEILCSIYAKLCYDSFVPGRNLNVRKVRSIEKNLEGCFDSGHGSVFEHCWLNFVTTNCSRVLTHELVRHRAGTAFSQTSGRYVRTGDVVLVADPLLESVQDEFVEALQQLEQAIRRVEEKIGLNDSGMSFDVRKQWTSSLRRLLPNGQANEIGWSCNLRAIRHLVMLRSSPHAEWEIRYVMNQVYDLLADRYPKLFYGVKVYTNPDGTRTFCGMKTQAYEVSTDYLQGGE